MVRFFSRTVRVASARFVLCEVPAYAGALVHTLAAASSRKDKPII